MSWWLVWQGLAYVAAGSAGYLVGARPARRGTRYRNDPVTPPGPRRSWE